MHKISFSCPMAEEVSVSKYEIHIPLMSTKHYQQSPFTLFIYTLANQPLSKFSIWFPASASSLLWVKCCNWCKDNYSHWKRNSRAKAIFTSQRWKQEHFPLSPKAPFAHLSSGSCGSERDMSLLEDALGGRSWALFSLSDSPDGW